MTTVMPLSQGEGDGINLVTYTYTSEPRTIPFSGSNRNSKNGRLLRGNNYVKDGMPQWDPYFAYARCLSRNDFQFYETDEIRQRREEFRKQLRERARVRRKNFAVTSVYQTNTLTPKGNKASGLLEASEGDISFHTTPRYKRQSQRPSVSVSTQVSEGERSSQLVTSRDPVTAEIKALVANTLRESSMEVAAEAEANRAKMEELAAERLAAINGNTEKGEDKEAPEEENENEDKEEGEDGGDAEAESETEGGKESAEEDEGGGQDEEEDKDDAEKDSNKSDGEEAAEKAESEADEGEHENDAGETDKEEEETKSKDDKDDKSDHDNDNNDDDDDEDDDDKKTKSKDDKDDKDDHDNDDDDDEDDHDKKKQKKT